MVANHWSDDGMVTIHRSGLVRLYLKYKYLLHKAGKLLRGVTVGHVERPGLVWINAPPTEDSNALL